MTQRLSIKFAPGLLGDLTALEAAEDAAAASAAAALASQTAAASSATSAATSATNAASEALDAEGSATAAASSASSAALAAASATASGDLYVDTTAGLAATSSGGYFGVPVGSSDPTAVIVYLDNAGVAVEQTRLPSIYGVPRGTYDSTEGGDLAGHPFSITDLAGRVLFAFDSQGDLTESRHFVRNIVEQGGVDNTEAAIRRLPRHEEAITYTQWNGVVGGGQSNMTGAGGSPLSTTADWPNLRWTTGTTTIPLLEASTHETPLTAMGAQSSYYRSRLLRPWETFEHTLVMYNMGAANTALSGIEQGTSPYNSGVSAVTGMKNAATAAGKTFAVRAVPFLHGENDTSGGTTMATYRDGIKTYIDDINTDYAAITGQTDRIPLFIGQHAPGSVFPNNDADGKMAIAMQQAAEQHDDIYIVFPGYVPQTAGGYHYTNWQQRHAGEYFGKAYHRYYIDRVDPSTVYPLSAEVIDSRTIEMQFYVPVPPLVFDYNEVWAHLFTCFNGFNVYTAAAVEITISDVWICDQDKVRIRTAANVAVGDTVKYALTYGSLTTGHGSGRHGGARGQLRDSDRTPSYYTDEDGRPYFLHNYCIAFSKVLT